MNKNTKIVWKPIDDLIPYERNAKEHTETQINNLAKSFEQNGWQNIVLIDENDVIIYGHGRCLGAKKAGLTEAPCVVCTDLSEEEIKRFRHLDNLLSEGDYIQEAFDLDVPDLSDYDFSELELNINLLGELEDFDLDTEIVEDDIPENVKTRCKLGDIWQLGEHRLICGDSTDITVIDRLMDGVKANMVFTDPPYGVSANGGRGDTKKKLKMQDIANDDLREDDLCDFLQSSFAIMPIKEGASIYICYPWATQEEFTKAIKNCGYTLQNCIIWRKNVFGLNGFKGYRPQYEMIYFCSKADYQWYGDLAQSNVWDFNRSTEHIGGHPTVKPIELIAKALQNSSKKEDCIYDAFGGSGSTLIACEQLNRKCYMAEISPKYCDVILQRRENFTGGKAVKVS